MKDRILSGPVPRSLRPGELGEASRAHRDYLRSLIADLPDPEQVIYHLPLAIVNALLAAYRSMDGCFRVQDEAAYECSLLGLCEVRGPYLTAFGMKVRRTLREEQQ